MARITRDDVMSKAPAGCSLIEVHAKGCKWWALACPQHSPGVHRYDLAGVPCYDYALSLADLHRALTRKAPGR